MAVVELLGQCDGHPPQLGQRQDRAQEPGDDADRSAQEEAGCHEENTNNGEREKQGSCRGQGRSLDEEFVVHLVLFDKRVAVEDDVVDGKVRDGGGHVRKMLRKPIARIQLNVAAALVGEQSDAVELALEHPSRAP